MIPWWVALVVGLFAFVCGVAVACALFVHPTLPRPRPPAHRVKDIDLTGASTRKRARR